MGFCAMASLGLPGLAGFWGEFPAILSAYDPAEGLKVETFRIFMVVAAVGTVLAAGYLLWLYQRAFFGERATVRSSRPSTTATSPTSCRWSTSPGRRCSSASSCWASTRTCCSRCSIRPSAWR